MSFFFYFLRKSTYNYPEQLGKGITEIRCILRVHLSKLRIYNTLLTSPRGLSLICKSRNLKKKESPRFFFQVFVYTPQVYLRIKERLKTRGVADLSSLELSNYFSPWYAEHMGAIQSASGNRSVESWAVERLRFQYYIFTYASLLKLHGDAALLRQLDSLLGNEALLQLQMRTLAPLFKEPKRREWFLEVIDNYFKLWEVNM